MPMYQTGNKRGFTLIEMLVVLVIIVLMSGVVALSIASSVEDARLSAGARMVIAMMRYARSYAITHHTETAVVLDTQGNGISMQVNEPDDEGVPQWRTLTTPAGRPRRLPEKVQIADVEVNRTSTQDSTDATDTDNNDNSTVIFSVLGQAEDTSITLRNVQEKELNISVDAVTGRCYINDSNDVQDDSKKTE
ncbi:MAG TPA: GspH/FimT family pseudopilin [Armatimonadota bacterium]|nr:GspH/FimT family pseudopilin [Armatimonadota bacterium]